MKCTIPEISWHNRDPVLSVDIQPNKITDSYYRLATGGTDSHVLIWFVTVEKGGVVNLECAADLTRHTKPVNCVRFSPSGELLASGDDESCIIIWKLKTVSDPVDFPSLGEEESYKEQWSSVRVLRGHLQDVYDICWSSDSKNLISGSVDNTSILWDVSSGKNLGILSEHKGFVQGVAWDPCGQYVATISSDRVCRVYNAVSRRVVSRLYKGVLPGKEAEAKPSHYFHDDTLKSFFRRLTFTPDGELLLVPSGLVEEVDKKPTNCVMVFSRHCLNKPCLYLPSLTQYSVAVRCCPVYFTLRPLEGPPLLELPYRVVIAVATQNSVTLYDTQHAAPFALISNIHYTRLTDLSWSRDGRMLVVSSTDGYCSVITFAEGEIGTVYSRDDQNTTANENNQTKKENVLSTEEKLNTSNKTNRPLPEDKNMEKLNTSNKTNLPLPEDVNMEKLNASNKTNLPLPEDANMAASLNKMEITGGVPAKEASSEKESKKSADIMGSKEAAMEVDDFQLVYEGTITEPVLETPQTSVLSSESEKSVKPDNVDCKSGEGFTKPSDQQSPKKSEMTLQQEAITSPIGATSTGSNSSKKTPRRVQLITLSSPKSKKKLIE